MSILILINKVFVQIFGQKICNVSSISNRASSRFLAVTYTPELIPGPVNNTLLPIFSSCPSEILYFTYPPITTSYKNQPIFTQKSPQTTPHSPPPQQSKPIYHTTCRLHTHTPLPGESQTSARP